MPSVSLAYLRAGEVARQDLLKASGNLCPLAVNFLWNGHALAVIPKHSLLCAIKANTIDFESLFSKSHNILILTYMMFRRGKVRGKTYNQGKRTLGKIPEILKPQVIFFLRYITSLRMEEFQRRVST